MLPRWDVGLIEPAVKQGEVANERGPDGYSE